MRLITRRTCFVCTLAFLAAAMPGTAAADHKIRVVGSSTVYPFAKKVADQFSKVTGLREYIDEFTNEWTLGPDGYLVEEGLIPLPKEDRKRNYYIARTLTPMSIDELQP